MLGDFRETRRDIAVGDDGASPAKLESGTFRTQARQQAASDQDAVAAVSQRDFYDAHAFTIRSPGLQPQALAHRRTRQQQIALRGVERGPPADRQCRMIRKMTKR